VTRAHRCCQLSCGIATLKSCSCASACCSCASLQSGETNPFRWYATRAALKLAWKCRFGRWPCLICSTAICWLSPFAHLFRLPFAEVTFRILPLPTFSTAYFVQTLSILFCLSRGAQVPRTHDACTDFSGYLTGTPLMPWRFL